LRTRTEQPAEYLKEVLTLIAFLHRSGELNGQYTLLENYRDRENQDSLKEQGSGNVNLNSSTTLQPESPYEEDDDEEEDEDMEEVG